MGALIAGGMSMVSGVNAAYDESQASAREQVQAADNQRLAESAAGDALQRGSREATLLRMRGTQLRSQQKVGYANSGVDASAGTALDTQGSTAALSELDARTAENNAAAEAWGFRRHGLQYQQQAALEASRSNARSQSYILGGAGRLASSAATYFGGD